MHYLIVQLLMLITRPSEETSDREKREQLQQLHSFVLTFGFHNVLTVAPRQIRQIGLY